MLATHPLPQNSLASCLCERIADVGKSRSSNARLGTSWSSSAQRWLGSLEFKRKLVPPRTRPGKHKMIICTLDTGTGSNNSDEDNGFGRSPFGLGSTRLGRIIRSGQKEFITRFKSVRKSFPTKIFLLLLGYYSANAFATILGQTGDWDVLAAGILVAVIEGIGYLMYRKPSPLKDLNIASLVGFVNYWKAGFSFGFFVDAFKLGS